MTETRQVMEASDFEPRPTSSRVASEEDRPTGRRREDRIVGASHATQLMIEQATTAARSHLPTLVRGPQGAGKQHLARAIHAWSRRATGPFVVLPVAGTPESLQESELFGGVAGNDSSLAAFPEGALSAAAGGTLLVHDVDQLSDETRTALIRAIKEGHFSRSGENQVTPLEARIVATSRSDQPTLLADLTTQTIEVPALGQRSEDVLPLAAHFLALYADEGGVKPIGFTADARRWLIDEEWVGNIRELRERIRQAVALAGTGAISAEALMLATEGEEVPSFKEAKRAFETRYVEGLLRRCSGNISRAARLAKKDRKDFYDVIRRTGVDPTRFRT